jgi:hypothetical protein
MHHNRAVPASHHETRISFAQQIRVSLLRKLWLPRLLYEALPYLYLVIGMAALASAVYVPGSGWILPYAILFAVICLHASLAIIALRYNYRRNKKPWHNKPIDGQFNDLN